MNRIGLVGNRPGIRALGLMAFALAMLLLAPALRADDAAPRAARLSYVDGKVRIAQGGDDGEDAVNQRARHQKRNRGWQKPGRHFYTVTSP